MLVPGADSVVVVLTGLDFRRILSEISNNIYRHQCAFHDTDDEAERKFHAGQVERLEDILTGLQSQG